MINNLFKAFPNRKIAVIGAGNIGQEVILYLKKQKYKQEIICIVDDGCKKMNSYQDISVLEMSEFIEMKNIQEFLFINTVTSIETNVYHELLYKKGIENIVDLNTEEIQAELSINRVKDYLNKREIRMDEPVLKIGNFIFPTPFLDKSIGVQMTFARDAGDLIFPIWLKDNHMCVSGPYESEHVRIEEGDVVIDIGANIGIGIANAVARGCEKVYAIEPVINKMLLECVNLYRSKVELHEYAIGNFEGCVEIGINPEITRNSSVFCRTNDLVVKKKVDMITLDHFVLKANILKLDFVKIYLDDKDLGIIEGAKKILKEMHPKLAIFPYASGNTEEFKHKISAKIQSINSEYHIECQYEKVFAYVE